MLLSFVSQRFTHYRPGMLRNLKYCEKPRNYDGPTKTLNCQNRCGNASIHQNKLMFCARKLTWSTKKLLKFQVDRIRKSGFMLMFVWDKILTFDLGKIHLRMVNSRNKHFEQGFNWFFDRFALKHSHLLSQCPVRVVCKSSR